MSKKSNHYILIDVLSLLEWKPLSRSVRMQTFTELVSELGYSPIDIQRGFGRALAATLAVLVREAIRSQKFKRKYEPLSEKYLKRKKRKGWHLGFWRASGYLMENIDVWEDKKDHAIYVGFLDTKIHPESGTSCAVIARTLETGSEKRNIPARPLFSDLARALGKDVSRWFRKYLIREWPHLVPIWDRV